MRIQTFRLWLALAGAILSAHAQWLNHPAPGTPLTRDGKPIPQIDPEKPANPQVNGTIDYARRDVVPLNFNNEVRIFCRFRDMKGRYVMHCHNVVHEDHAMMVRWDIV